MKAPLFTLLGIACAVIGCSRVGRVLTVPEALEFASAKEKEGVTVAGYYLAHFEGDELGIRPGRPTGIGVFISFSHTFRERNRITGSSLGPAFDGKFVHLTGTLKRGAFFGSVGTLDNCVFLIVDDAKPANKALEPTPTAVTAPAAQEPRQP